MKKFRVPIIRDRTDGDLVISPTLPSLNVCGIIRRVRSTKRSSISFSQLMTANSPNSESQKRARSGPRIAGRRSKRSSLSGTRHARKQRVSGQLDWRICAKICEIGDQFSCRRPTVWLTANIAALPTLVCAFGQSLLIYNLPPPNNARRHDRKHAFILNISPEQLSPLYLWLRYRCF
jgi:hypothetical protein